MVIFTWYMYIYINGIPIPILRHRYIEKGLLLCLTSPCETLLGWDLYRQLELTKLTSPDLHHIACLFILNDVHQSLEYLCIWILYRQLKLTRLTRPDLHRIAGLVIQIDICLSIHLKGFPDIDGMTWNWACGCIMTTCKTDYFEYGLLHFNHTYTILKIFVVPSIFCRTPRRNGLKFGMLTYPDHLHQMFGHGLLIVFILHNFEIANRVKLKISRHFMGNKCKE